MPPPLSTRTLPYLPDEVATQTLGMALGRVLHPGLIVALNGPLGAGKSSLARALIRSWGITDTIKSPSYSWVESYAVPQGTLNHFDFYRFKDQEDWDAYGFESYFDTTSMALIEWSEKVIDLLPPVDLALQLDYQDSGRRITATSLTSAGDVCLTALMTTLSNPAFKMPA